MFDLYIDDNPRNNILGVSQVFGDVEGFARIRTETASDSLVNEVLLPEVDGRDDGVVEEKVDCGTGPEEFVVEIDVEPVTHQSSLRVLYHQISEHSDLVSGKVSLAYHHQNINNCPSFNLFVALELLPEHNGDCSKGHDRDEVAGPQVDQQLAGKDPLWWL